MDDSVKDEIMVYNGKRYRLEKCEDHKPCSHCSFSLEECDEYIDNLQWLPCGEVFTDNGHYCKIVEE